MLRYIYGSDLHRHSRLGASMFEDRATQFKHRQGWDVTVDDAGHERDEYDDINPLYVLWEQPNGRHGGSMRFLPTTGQTMVHDHFLDLTNGVDITSPLIWECTRFCLAPNAESRVAAALMLAGGELMRAFHLTHFIGVFDARMVRIYRMIGSSPEVLGEAGKARDHIAVGLWEYNPASRARVLNKAKLSSDVSERWFERSFGQTIGAASKAQTAA